MRTLLLAAGLAGLVLPAAATAAELQARDGLYLRGAAGRVDLPASGPDAYTGSDVSYSIGAGWRFLRWFNLDAGYEYLGEYEGHAPGPGGPMDARLTALTFGVGATVDFGDSGFFAQARAGVHRWEAKTWNIETESRTTGTDPYYGIGVGYDFSETFGLVLSVERFRMDDVRFGDMDRVMLGFELR